MVTKFENYWIKMYSLLYNTTLEYTALLIVMNSQIVLSNAILKLYLQAVLSILLGLYFQTVPANCTSKLYLKLYSKTVLFI